jgi:hypothetical protein
VRSGGSSEKLGADEGGYPTPAGGVLWGVKSRGLAIRLNSYLTAEKEIVGRLNRSWVNGLLMSTTVQKLGFDFIAEVSVLVMIRVI